MTIIYHEESSGNVYADLGLPDAEAMKRKSRIAAYIQMEIESQELTRAARLKSGAALAAAIEAAAKGADAPARRGPNKARASCVIVDARCSKKQAAMRLDIRQTRLTAILQGQFREIDELILVSYLHRLGAKSIKVTV
jgi:predicted XRE-type DNA-binding protein